MKIFLAILLILLISLATADVSGKIVLANGKPARLAVIFLEGDGAKPKPIANAMIDQRGKKFQPHVIAVPVGTTVKFPNNDLVFHNVFAEYNAKRFDLGMYPRGATRTQTFAKPGLVALFCSVHSDMSAFIMVVDTPYYAVADSSGHFDIKNVPAGEYSLKVWHESGELLQEKIRVGSNKSIDLQTRR